MISSQAFDFIFANQLVMFPEADTVSGRRLMRSPGPMHIPALPGVYWVLAGGKLPVWRIDDTLRGPKLKQIGDLEGDRLILPELFHELSSSSYGNDRSKFADTKESVMESSSCLYVGQSKDIQKRWAGGHHRYEFLEDMRCSGTPLAFGYMVLPPAIATAESLLTLEKSVIQLLKPWLNDTTVPRLSRYGEDVVEVEEEAAIALPAEDLA